MPGNVFSPFDDLDHVEFWRSYFENNLLKIRFSLSKKVEHAHKAHSCILELSQIEKISKI